MAEKTVNELLKKYLGISVLRITIGVLMLLFGTMILAWPDLLAVLVAIYLVINGNGVLVFIDEALKSRALKSKWEFQSSAFFTRFYSVLAFTLYWCARVLSTSSRPFDVATCLR